MIVSFLVRCLARGSLEFLMIDDSRPTLLAKFGETEISCEKLWDWIWILHPTSKTKLYRKVTMSFDLLMLWPKPFEKKKAFQLKANRPLANRYIVCVCVCDGGRGDRGQGEVPCEQVWTGSCWWWGPKWTSLNQSMVVEASHTGEWCHE